jgi:hypothetical protein
MLSVEEIGRLLLTHWSMLGDGESAPGRLSFLVVTKGRERVSKLVLLAFPGAASSPRFAVKLPRSKAVSANLQAEYHNLQAVAPFASSGRVLTPKPLLCRDEGGWLCLVESVIDGVELSQAAGVRPEAVVEPIVDWLVHLGRSTLGVRSSAGAAEDLPDLLERAQRYVTTDAERHVLSDVAGHLGRLHAEPLPRVFEQRDMGPWNLMVSRNQTLGVLDWESSCAGGFPAWDLFYFLAHYGFMVHRSDDRGDRMKTFEDTFWGRHGFSRTARTALRRYVRGLGLREEWLGPLSAACWLHHTLSEASRLGIRPSESLFWQMLTATLARGCRLSCAA